MQLSYNKLGWQGATRRRTERRCTASAGSVDAAATRDATVTAAPLHASRRLLLLSNAAAAALFTSACPAARAADLTDLLNRTFPPAPEPVLFPRKPLNRRFAVLLMRSSYEALDALNITPMEKFQINFWKLRQSEQESYNLQYSPLKPRVGELTDPLYLDFIAFSQYASISREMARPQQAFKEFCSLEDTEPCPNGESRMVQRDPAVRDDMLPQAFYKSTGDALYDGLVNGFQEEQFGGPAALAAGASLSELVAGVSRLLQSMVDAGYALKAEVVESETAAAPGGFTVRLQGPANLWGLTALRYRRSLVINAYDAMAIEAFLRASGRRATYKLETTDTGIVEEWQLLGDPPPEPVYI